MDISFELLNNIFSGEDVAKIDTAYWKDYHKDILEITYNDDTKQEYSIEALEAIYNTSMDTNIKFRVCDCCDNVYIYNCEQEIDTICETCFNDNYIRCNDCNKLIEIGNEHILNGDISVCDHCFDNNYWYCEGCNTFYHNDESSYQLHSGDLVCQECFDNDYFECDECGEIFSTYQSNYIEGEDDEDDNDRHVCNACYNGGVIMGRIYDYHGFNSWNMLGDDSDLRFGFELEVERCHSDVDCSTCAKKVYEIMENEIICSHDGSLDNGFEIISHPMTFNYLLSRQNNIKALLKYLSDVGYRSHDPQTCGLHIHVTRAALGDDIKHVDKTINNILMIFENFIKELTLFSRRDEGRLNRWAQFVSKYRGFDGDVLSMKYVSDNKETGCRYMAVNLQPTNTVEFRLFRGTLNYNTFMATFYLVKNIIEYAKTKETINGLTWKRLIGRNKILKDYCLLRNIESSTVCNEIIIKFENKKKSVSKVRNVSAVEDTYNNIYDGEVAYVEALNDTQRSVNVNDVTCHHVCYDTPVTESGE